MVYCFPVCWQNKCSLRLQIKILRNEVVKLDQYFSVVLVMTLCKPAYSTHHSSESYWAVICWVLFIMLNKVFLTLASVGEILKCDHSNESYWAVLYSGTVYYAVQGDSNNWACGQNPKVWLFSWKLMSNSFLVVMSIMLCKVALLLRL